MVSFAGIPFPVQFFLVFVIMLVLVGAIAWAARALLRGGRLGGVPDTQPRLAVIDYASVDRNRGLILVRRDNVEHLMMIGGPTDIVVESNIACGGLTASHAIPLPKGAGPDGRPDARQGNREIRQEPQRLLLATQSARPSPSTDHILAEMANRLEAAFRKPTPKAERKEASEPHPALMPRAELVAAVDVRAAPPLAATPPAAAVPLSPRAVRADEADSKPPWSGAKSQASAKRVYDSLEQEMASLLGH